MSRPFQRQATLEAVAPVRRTKAVHHPTPVRAQTRRIPNGGKTVRAVRREAGIRLPCFHKACRESIGSANTVEHQKDSAENSRLDIAYRRACLIALGRRRRRDGCGEGLRGRTEPCNTGFKQTAQEDRDAVVHRRLVQAAAQFV